MYNKVKSVSKTVAFALLVALLGLGTGQALNSNTVRASHCPDQVCSNDSPDAGDCVHKQHKSCSDGYFSACEDSDCTYHA